METLYDEFAIKNVHYIFDESPANEIGVLFQHHEALMEDKPSYFFCMRYNLCSSFPLTDMLEQFKRLE